MVSVAEKVRHGFDRDVVVVSLTAEEDVET
jgi:hypothetical protein